MEVKRTHHRLKEPTVEDNQVPQVMTVECRKKFSQLHHPTPLINQVAQTHTHLVAHNHQITVIRPRVPSQKIEIIILHV